MAVLASVVLIVFSVSEFRRGRWRYRLIKLEGDEARLASALCFLLGVGLLAIELVKWLRPR